MKNFNMDEFKKGEIIAVNCNTKEKAVDFLTRCKKENIKWNSGREIEPNKKTNFEDYGSETCYSVDCFGFGFADLLYHQNNNFKIIEWQIEEEKEEKKIYKIQDLLKGEFIGREATHDGEIFIVTGDSLITCYGEDIEDCYNMRYILNAEFELVDKENKETDSIDKDSKIYIAGSLFTEAEIAQRLKEEKLLREIGFENIFNPINSPQNNKEKLPTCLDIFYGDTDYILDSDIVTVDITNPSDSGINCELGIIWMCNYLHKLKEQGMTLEQIIEMIPKKQLIAVNSDIRKPTAHCYKGDEIPVGFNQFQVGLIKDIGVIKDNFKEVLEELKGGK